MSKKNAETFGSVGEKFDDKHNYSCQWTVYSVEFLRNPSHTVEYSQKKKSLTIYWIAVLCEPSVDRVHQSYSMKVEHLTFFPCVRQKFIKPRQKCDRYDSSHRRILRLYDSFVVEWKNFYLYVFTSIRKHMLQISVWFRSVRFKCDASTSFILLNQLFYDVFFL